MPMMMMMYICFLFLSDRPQMVQLNKLPSEFITSRMRDSFMRQFLEQGNDRGIGRGSTNENDGQKVRSDTGALHVTPSKKKSLTHMAEKKLGVAEIIRYVAPDIVDEGGGR